MSGTLGGGGSGTSGGSGSAALGGNVGGTVGSSEASHAGEGVQVHPTAIVHPRARLGRQVRVGPYVVVGPEVEVGDGTVIEAFAVLEGPCCIGPNSRIGTGAVVGGAPQDVHYQGEPTQLIVEEEVYLGPYATVSRGTPKGGGITRIGPRCVVGYGAHVGHDCQLGPRVHLEPLAALAGHVVVDEGAEIGALAGVHQFVRIGRMALVEPHAMVGKDVPPFVRVGGNPAGFRGLNEQALGSGRLSEPAREAVQRAVDLLYRSGLTAAEAARRMEQELGQFEEVRELAAFVRRSGRGVTR